MRKLSLFFVSFVFVLFLFVSSSKADFEDLKSLSFGFCSWSAATMIIPPGEQQDLCLYFANIAEKDISIKLGFTEWSITSDWTRACKDDDSIDNPFAKLFTLSDTNIYTIPAGGDMVIKFPIVAPAWINWQQDGCLTYQSVEREAQTVTWWFFGMVFRNSIHLSLIVLDKEWTFKNSIDESFSMSINTLGEMIISAEFVNNSDFDENIVFTGTVSNILWFQKDFDRNFILKLKESKKITLNIGKVPNYKWLFNLNVDWSYQPYFNGIVVDMEQFKEAVSFSDSASLFVSSPILLIITASIILLLLLLIFALFRKRKIVYVKA